MGSAGTGLKNHKKPKESMEIELENAAPALPAAQATPPTSFQGELYEPTANELAAWRKKYTHIKNGNRVFKPTSKPAFQKKWHSRGFHKIVPAGTEHLSGRRDTTPNEANYERDESIDRHGLARREREEEPTADYTHSDFYNFIQRAASAEAPITTDPKLNIGFGPGVGVTHATRGLLAHIIKKSRNEIRQKRRLERIRALSDLFDWRIISRAFPRQGDFDTEAELLKIMEKDYRGREIARSKVIETTTRTTTTKKPKPLNRPPHEVIDIIEQPVQTPFDLWRRAINNTFKELYSGVDGMYILLQRHRQPVRAYLLAPLDEAFEALTYSDRGYIIDSGHLKFLINKLAKKLGLAASVFRAGRSNIKFLTFDGDKALVHDYAEFLDDEKPLKRGQLRLTS
jgi:hypothetical protein